MAVAADEGWLEDDRRNPGLSRKGKMEVLTISELTEWLFGYRTPAQVAKIPYGEFIEPFHGVFLDEVVEMISGSNGA